ncbi:MAG: SDR family oxidoreductase [Acidimicrobiia bacterium]|nr:SDR family oxidoreductase [Acidimicrobiia bacterium]
MELRIDDQIAVITGGSRGIGKAMAAAFIEAGAQVMITGRKPDACEAAAAELGERCAWMAGDASKAEVAEETVAATIERFGRLDILVNNAGASPYSGPTIDVDRKKWDVTMAVNLTAPLLWTQAAWQAAMQENGGSIINVASVGAFGTNAWIGVYNISKAACVHLTEQLAAELAPTVRVNALAPGLIKTDFSRLLWEDGRGEAVAAQYPLERLGEVEDAAAAALYLAADSARWITGQTIVLDGGGLVAFRQV